MYDINDSPYTIDIIETTNMKYPPTKNRAGRTRGAHDIKTLIRIKTDLVKVPTLITSDLHSHTEAVFNDLQARGIDLSQYMIITAGDMAGDLIYGSDGDPTEYYAMINSKCDKFYIIQGNHDLPPIHITDLNKLTNKDGSKCMLPDGDGAYKTENGIIAGVHGTISYKSHPYKKADDAYYALIDNVLKWHKPDILVTHDTPSIIVNDKERLIGKNDLYEKVTNKNKPKIHIYGHCHHRYVMVYKRGVMFISADSRVIILEPL